MNGTVSERARLDTTLYLVTDSSYHTEESFSGRWRLRCREA